MAPAIHHPRCKMSVHHRLTPFTRCMVLVGLGPIACLQAFAQAAAEETQTVVVTGSVRAQRVLDAPYAIGVVDAQALRDAGPMVNLSEALQRVPGLTVANRNNYAQDLQI